MECFSLCHTGGKAFTRRVVHSVAVAIAAWNNFVLLLKNFIANEQKCKARLKDAYPLPWMYPLVMSPFSHDFMKTKIN